MQSQVIPKFNWHTELLYGISAEANDFFPERDPQYGLILGLGQTFAWDGNPQTKNLEIGILGMYSDLGNTDRLGQYFALIPYVSFPLFGPHKSETQMQFGLGGAYFNTGFDPEVNFFNQAITTDITWAFRGSIHRMIWSNTRGILDAGLVYNHQSNGHTKLPNQGLNSFLISLRQTWNNLSDGNYSKSDRYINSRPVDKISRGNQSELLDSDVVGDEEIVTQLSQYLEARFGYGLNVLALAFNDLRPVRTFSITWGQTHNGHFRWGIGAFYRFYQHYHDYIKGNESLVRPGQEFDEFRVNPLRYSSNFGVHFNGEVLIGHFGLSTQLGLNFYKPGYGIDWRINEGWDYAPRELPPNWVLGKYNTKYQLKKHLSTRLGLRYYLWSTQENTLRLGAISSDSIYINPFLGAHINANLGQADFSEVSFGVIFHLGQSHN